MFSPATRRSNFSSRKDVTPGLRDSPATPLTENRRSLHHNLIPNRPSTGTPAPWAPRLSVLARIPPAKKGENGDDIDPTQPVYVAEFPQVLRDEQDILLQNSGDTSISGGIDEETSLAWIACGHKLFLWSYLAPSSTTECAVLHFPISASGKENSGKKFHPKSWLVSVINWDGRRRSSQHVAQCYSVGVIACNQNTRTLIYWPEIFSEGGTYPIISLASPEESEMIFPSVDAKSTPGKLRTRAKFISGWSGSTSFNSIIASAIPGAQQTCMAFVCSSNGELWQFLCSHSGIQRKRIFDVSQDGDGSQYARCKGYPRSLAWNFLPHSAGVSRRQFLLLTDHEIQCFAVDLAKFDVLKLWSHEIVGTDADLGIQKDLAGQKQIWPLDLQVDNDGKVITILIAIFCKDRVTSSNYTEYSLLTMQYKSGVNVASETFSTPHQRVLEKKAPVQVIIPKARVENEEFLFSMRLKVGGKPAGSVVIISGDGTATVSTYRGNSTRLYQFDLPYDAGKVIDASVLPSDDDGEDGAWAVLTEKAGVWAIPERAVLLGGVEPPERSLSRKGSSNERSSQDERRNSPFAGNIAPRRASSEAWDAGDRQRASLTGIARRAVQDEESETLLNNLFHEFLLAGQVDGALDKLKSSGAFERDGVTNVFTRMSKSIVDTLAKHWTTTRGSEIVVSSVVSTQLMEKQQKHQKFLQFLAISKCHEELCSKQRLSLQIIMEHGEKLAGMIKLRELHNSNSRDSFESSDTQMFGVIWDLIQIVGERARRRMVLLMDRDNAEVFYSKVSDLDELFYCLEKQLEHILNGKRPLAIQYQRACELSNACVALLHASIDYRNQHHLWYPPPEGLIPWYCQEKVRNGLWSIASFMLQLLDGSNFRDNNEKMDFCLHLRELSEMLLEAYSGAIMAKDERREGHKGLLDECWSRRDDLLGSLYKQVKGFVQSELQESREGNEQNNEENVRKLSSGLLSLAKRHEGYQTLWDICRDYNDPDLLTNLMHESMGPKGGFCCFVFRQLYDNKQFSELMRLGEEFPEELAIFLKQHKDLLWLHEVFLHKFSSASETLHRLAFSGDDSRSSVAEIDSHATNAKTTLADRKRFLNLSKIAALAGRDADFGMKVKRIEADLKILRLQEEIMKLLPDNEEKQRIVQQPLPPVDLIELCLESNSREFALRVFDVFAWTSFSFLKCNTSLLEQCWRNAANQDDWAKLYKKSQTEGWNDEETLHFLEKTVLFQASNRCYGPKAATFEGSFDDVLPLRHESPELQTPKVAESSVEAILMQHKDFPDAGKLMVIAIMLGAEAVDAMDESPASFS